MSFGADIRRFARKVDATQKAVFVNSISAAKDSITVGSTITGAPGQPVDEGTLRASWQEEFPTPTSARITTNLEYAPGIEAGIGPHGPLTLRSSVGGFHSVALTIAGFDRIVEDEARKLNEGADA